MICTSCSHQNPAAKIICDQCGELLREPGEGHSERLAGQVINGYRIDERLGSGVYLATSQRTRRRVAFKVLPLHDSDWEFIERFEREARVVKRLKHPAVVGFEEIFKTDVHYCIAMHYEPGGSVNQLVEREGPLPPLRACLFVHDAALGLWAAARKGIVHRDVKPDNLLISADGHVKVADFGLARGRETVQLTRTGMVLGTWAYMAPEQWDDMRKVDHRSDLYALGCSFFAMLTGTVPFPGSSSDELMEQHLQRPAPDLSLLMPDLDPRIADIVHKLMQKDPADRFQTGKELADALTPLIDGERPGAARRHTLLWVLCALALCGLAAAAAWELWGG